MIDALPEHLLKTVELICESGCEQVNQTIDRLQHHQDTEPTRDLNAEERQQVLKALRNIMSVYDNK